MKLPKNFNTLLPPFEFQKEVIGRSILYKNPGILLPMGTGKTYCLINVARYHIQNDGFKKILILCPASIIFKWDNEIKKFSEYKSAPIHSATGTASRKSRIEMLKQDAEFYIVNYEFVDNVLDNIIELNPDFLVLDESSRYVRNVGTKRTNASIILSDIAKKRALLTGTLINKPMDLWSQFRILDGGSTYGKNFYKWRNFFFEYESYGRYGKWVLRNDRISVLKKGIHKSCIIKTKEECLPYLPDKKFDILEIKMSDELRLTYNNVRTKILSEIATEEGRQRLNIKSIFEKIIRLQQITSGFIISEDKSKYVMLNDTPKLDVLVEDISNIVFEDESVIVWCKFLKSIENIGNRLKKENIRFVTMSGKDSAAEKYKKWTGFQENNSINVFIGQIESGGIGIELFKKDSLPSRSQWMLFFENSLSLDTRLQAIDRIHRPGQLSNCMYRDYIVLDTFDEKIMASIKEMKHISDLIMKNRVENFI